MAGTIDELTINWQDEQGKLSTRELDKRVISKGGLWVTVIFLYQDLNHQTGEYGPPKARIQRYQKRNDRYIPQSKFNISSAKQARQIVEILQDWFDEE
ncbi:MAG: hypothetical protein JXQ83_10775 [Candidatus Glassbacteria bacterium]|nr:hypothetical protein [Candidatus Glassbacteria bacterium]